MAASSLAMVPPFSFQGASRGWGQRTTSVVAAMPRPGIWLKLMSVWTTGQRRRAGDPLPSVSRTQLLP